MTQLSILAKKTKADILSEYEELLKKYEENKSISDEVNNQENVELVKKAGNEWTQEAAMQVVAKYKNLLNDNINNLSNKINEQTSVLLRQIVSMAEKLADLQKAVELSERRLELDYKIKVAAGVLEKLVLEYQEKSKSLEQEFSNKKMMIEDEIRLRKQEWKREQEEYDYNLKAKRGKENILYEENRIQKEKELNHREEAIKSLEEEYGDMKNLVAGFPQELESKLAIRTDEITKSLTKELNASFELLQKDWGAEKSLLEAKIIALEDLKIQREKEIARLLQEVETTKKLSQELAVKVIESNSFSLRKQEGEVVVKKESN